MKFSFQFPFQTASLVGSGLRLRVIPILKECGFRRVFTSIAEPSGLAVERGT